MFKKILSVILVFILFMFPMQKCVIGASCDDKNEQGNYADYYCAYEEGKRLLSKENKDYVEMKNIGENADESLYFFSYRALDKILNKFKIYSEKEIENPLPLVVNCKSNSALFVDMLLILLAKTAGATIGIGLTLLANALGTFRYIPNIDRRIERIPGMKKIFNKIPNMVKNIPVNKFMVLLGGLSGAAADTSSGDSNTDIDMEINEEFLKNKLELKKDINDNIYALKSLLAQISDNEHYKNDFVFFNFSPSTVFAEFNKADLSYSEEEKDSFNKIFEKIKQELNTLLNGKEV